MDKVRLIYNGISGIVGSDKVCLLTLTDIDEKRQLTVVCDAQVEYQFGLRDSGVMSANRLLPEALLRLVDGRTLAALEMVIESVEDGQYNVVMRRTDTGESYPIRACDAVLLSYISTVPLYIDQRLMMRQSIEYKRNSNGISIPINTLSDDMLERAMQKAIAEENYEVASLLRDERLRRKHDTEH